MNRYKMELIVDVPHGEDRGEKLLKVNITAPSEIDARRAALERAWSYGYSIRRFLTYKYAKEPHDDRR
jgi:hypothetical protein